MDNGYDSAFEEALREAKLVDDGQLEKLRELREETGADMVDLIVEQGWAERGEVMKVMSRHLHIPYRRLSIDMIDPAAVGKIPPEIAAKHRVIPITIAYDTILLGTYAPLDIESQEDISFASGYSLKPVLVDRPEVEAAIEHFFPEAGGLEEVTEEEGEIELLEVDRGDAEGVEEGVEVDEDRFVSLVSRLMAEAVRRRASDIHVEPKMDHSVVRYRVDGILEKVEDLPAELHDGVVSRIKILATMDAAEKRRPQDGVIFMRYGNKDVDFRVATSPTIYGESVALRVLEQSKAGIELEDLGFDEDDLEKVSKGLTEPYGFILATGPTGSGRTTTMYAMLNRLDAATRKVVTIEEPVAYRMEDVTQLPVNNPIGLGFAPLLRSVLRQDPDVILVGEIRDAETAHTAVQAALTGRLLLSTLHTTGAPEVIPRLIDIGIEYYYVREVVKLIIAQRLARRVCPECREPYEPGEAELAEMGLAPVEGLTLYRAIGCKGCGGTGYRERVGIYEVLPMSGEIRDLITPAVRLDDIMEVAVSQGMTTLWQNGVEKVIAGLTTLEEIRRTLPR